MVSAWAYEEPETFVSHPCELLLWAAGCQCEQLEQFRGSEQSNVGVGRWEVKRSLHLALWGSCKSCIGSGSRLVVRIKSMGKCNNAS